MLFAFSQRRKLAAIAVMHRSAGHDSPTAHAIVRATLAGICRDRGIAPRPKTAMLVDELRAALATCGERTIDIRDRALMLVGFAGALRRSELVGLDVDDVRFEGRSSYASVVPRPTQEGALEEVAVLYGSDPRTCPVRALQARLATSGLVTGPLFRSVDRRGRPADGADRRRAPKEDRRAQRARSAELRGPREPHLVRRDLRPFPLRVVTTSYDARLRIAREARDPMPELAGDGALLQTAIRENVALREAVGHQEPIRTYRPMSSGALDYAALTTEIFDHALQPQA